MKVMKRALLATIVALSMHCYAAGPLAIKQILTTRVLNTTNNTGQISWTIDGGTPPYTYTITNTLTGASNTGIPKFSTVNVFPEQPAGTYKIAASDTSGMSISAQAQIADIEPIQITEVDITNPPTATSNGSVTVIAKGGTAPYQWFQNGVLQPPPADCSEMYTFPNLPAGPNGTTYIFQVVAGDGTSASTTVTLFSLAGVTAAASAAVTAQPSVGADPGPLVITQLTATRALSSTGSGTISVTVSGGTGTYQYSLTPITTPPTPPVPGTPTTATNNTFPPVAAGSYMVQVTSGAVTVFAYIAVAGPSAVQIFETDVTNPTCSNTSDGSISVSVQGGTTPYTYSKDGGTTSVTSSNTTFPFNGLTGAPNPGLDYPIVVVSNEGSVASETVPLVTPTPISIMVDVIASLV